MTARALYLRRGAMLTRRLPTLAGRSGESVCANIRTVGLETRQLLYNNPLPLCTGNKQYISTRL